MISKKILKILSLILLSFIGLGTSAYWPQSFCFNTKVARLVNFFSIFVTLLLGLLIFFFVFSYLIKGKTILKFLGIFALSLMSTFSLIFIEAKIKNIALKSAVNRAILKSDSILNQISNFKLQNGYYPNSETFLNFKNLNTNICGYPIFNYVLSSKKGETLDSIKNRAISGETMFVSSPASDTGGFELFIDMSGGFLNWDTLVYWPSEKYPERIKGGSAEPFGRWVYIHE